MHDAGSNVGASPPLNSKKSYDVSWQPLSLDERDEVDLTSGDETDETDLDQDDLDDEEQEEEPTQAVMLAEEGRGLIVHGEGVPTVQLQVQNGMSICPYGIVCLFFPHPNPPTPLDPINRLSPLHLPQSITSMSISISVSVFGFSFIYHSYTK